MAYHVRIDHLTQGADGHEIPADRLSVDHEDFLRIYVEAELPSGNAPKGEYCKIIAGRPGPKVGLGEPQLVGDQYRFVLIHYVLSGQSEYLFHFADNLSGPKYEDQWEVHTI